MRRLRPLSEAECYIRCYGSWDATVRIVHREPSRRHPARRVSGEALRRGFEERLDARTAEELAAEAAEAA